MEGWHVASPHTEFCHVDREDLLADSHLAAVDCAEAGTEVVRSAVVAEVVVGLSE